jgi:hypothetical protein
MTINWGSIKHGDSVKANILGKEYDARIEERFISQSPNKRTSKYIVIEGHFPIEYNDFLKNYGTIIK